MGARQLNEKGNADRWMFPKGCNLITQNMACHMFYNHIVVRLNSIIRNDKTRWYVDWLILSAELFIYIFLQYFVKCNNSRDRITVISIYFNSICYNGDRKLQEQIAPRGNSNKRDVPRGIVVHWEDVEYADKGQNKINLRKRGAKWECGWGCVSTSKQWGEHTGSTPRTLKPHDRNKT